MSTSLARLLNKLAATKPGSSAAKRLTMQAELAMLRIVKSGKRAAEAAIKAVRVGKARFTREFSVSNTAQWRATLDERDPKLLVVWYSAGQYLQATYVQFGSPTPQKTAGTPAQRAKHEAQETFYARYMEIGQRWYRGRGPRRLPVWDNRILLIGELEADVNNGGFSQYLDNKGRRRAQAALAALKAVGATKTATMLSSAMASDVTPKQLDALDARFYRVPEDLAVLTMRRVRRVRAL